MDQKFFSNIFGTQKFMDPNLINIIFLDPKLFGPNIFLDPKSFLNPKTFLAQKLFWPINVFGPKNYFYTQNFHLDKHFFGTKFFLTQKMFRPKFFLTEKDLVWSFGINQPNQILVNQRLSKLNTLDLSLVSFSRGTSS